MNAEIKDFYSSDIFNLETFQPQKTNEFAFELQIIAGIKGKEGGDSFDIFVCTPQWLIKNYKKEDILFGRHRLIMFQYNYESLLNKINQYIEMLEEDSWDKLAEKINLIGRWEFFDYTEYTKEPILKKFNINTTRAEIKHLYSPEINNLEKFYPANEEEFSFSLQMTVGEKENENEMNFHILVCSPQWLIKYHQPTEIVFGIHHIFMFEYNYEALVMKLKKYIGSLEEENWNNLVRKINLI
jgi:hypothetical protein